MIVVAPHSRRFGAMAAATAIALLLAGCATPPALSPSAGASAAPATSTQALRSEFALAGRFSAKSDKDNASGQFRYAQTPTQRTMALFSPLGTPLGEIVATRERVTLTLANGEVQTAPSLGDLLRRVIDVPLDDAMLGAWLQGLPATAAAPGTIERDATGRPSRFMQRGWEVVVTGRHEDGAATGLPRRMRWALVAQPEVEVRWVIDEWTVR